MFCHIHIHTVRHQGFVQVPPELALESHCQKAPLPKLNIVAPFIAGFLHRKKRKTQSQLFSTLEKGHLFLVIH
ncbi:hypothetical protein DITRI_Ditri16bG0104100 [Diplodiscus trichospermus]